MATETTSAGAASQYSAFDIKNVESSTNFYPEDKLKAMTAIASTNSCSPTSYFNEARLKRPRNFNTYQHQREVISQCIDAYNEVGILRNVIDTMATFASQGIDIIHPNKNKERFYRAWFKKVSGPERTERMLNMLFKAGNVLVKRDVAKLNQKDLEDFQRAIASANPDVKYVRMPKVNKGEIPISYRIMSPLEVETDVSLLSTFLSTRDYYVKVPKTTMNTIRSPKSRTDKQLVEDLTPWIKEGIKKGEYYIYMDNDKLTVKHYMKDDSQVWAFPIAYSILDDLLLYQSYKQADRAALRAMAKHVRVWKLGNVEKGAIPGEAAFLHLDACLRSNPDGTTIDLLWDEFIDLLETSVEPAKFLGSEKYQTVLAAIFGGLGIPAVLSAGFKAGGNSESATISFKGFIERLQYGRSIVNSIWEEELRIVKEAIGDRQQPKITYKNMNLYQEANEKAIWIDLVDRSVISHQTIQELFDVDSEVETARLRREDKAREKESLPLKASPFHNDVQHKNAKELSSLNQGTVAPSEIGVKKKPKEKGDKSLLDHNKELAKLTKKEGAPPDTKTKGQPGQGRPKNSVDKKPRKEKVKSGVITSEDDV